MTRIDLKVGISMLLNKVDPLRKLRASARSIFARDPDLSLANALEWGQGTSSNGELEASSRPFKSRSNPA